MMGLWWLLVQKWVHFHWATVCRDFFRWIRDLPEIAAKKTLLYVFIDHSFSRLCLIFPDYMQAIPQPNQFPNIPIFSPQFSSVHVDLPPLDKEHPERIKM